MLDRKIFCSKYWENDSFSFSFSLGIKEEEFAFKIKFTEPNYLIALYNNYFLRINIFHIVIGTEREEKQTFRDGLGLGSGDYLSLTIIQAKITNIWIWLLIPLKYMKIKVCSGQVQFLRFLLGSRNKNI